MNRTLGMGFGLLLGLTVSAASSAQNNFDDVVIEAQPLGSGVFMLTGRGGNLGLSTGDDATFLIDDQYAPLTEKIEAAIAGVTDRPIDYVLNTHWHFDHSGGNENLGKKGALIVAHDNVRQRMKTGQRLERFNTDIPPSPKVALPVFTFDQTLSLHANELTIVGIHVPHAHTDGDTTVHFEEANILHMGDVFFNGLYPFIDLESGGSVDGVIAAVDVALELVDDDTKIIPGHGPLADKGDLEDYRTMLSAIRTEIALLLDDGKDVDEILAAKPSAVFDASANANGFLTPDQFVISVIKSLDAQ